MAVLGVPGCRAVRSRCVTLDSYRDTPAERVSGTVRETVGFFGRNTEKMLGITYSPEGEARGAVVICPPVFLEKVITNQAETELARTLARRGIAVQRFDYRGFGHSDGDGRDVTYDAMVEDGADAVGLLRELHPTPNLGFVGSRWGTLVAATIARSLPGAPLAMWEPLLSGRSFVREASRAVAISALTAMAGRESAGPAAESAGSAAEKPRKLASIIEEDGMADVFGYPIHKAFYDSSVTTELSTEMGSDPRPLQVVTFGDDPIQGPRKKLIDEWERQGFSVSSHMSEGVPVWWFLGERPLNKKELADVTASWLVRHLDEEAQR